MVEEVINNHLDVKMNITLDICTTLDLDGLKERLEEILTEHKKYTDTAISIIKTDVKNVSLCSCSGLED